MAKKGRSGLRLQMRRADVQRVVRNLRAAGKRGLKAAGAGLYAVGLNIMAEAVIKAPLDVGTLRGSGYVTLPEIQGRNVVAEMGFGGPAADYAVYQHENTALNHPDDGEAKYLEKAIDRQMSGTAQGVFVKQAAKAFARGEKARKQNADDPWEGWQG